MNEKRLSKFLSLVLRHKPETINLNLDVQGWAKVDDLLTEMQRSGKSVNRERLEHIVAKSDKKRFAFSENHTHIRASQGHSLNIELGLEPQKTT